MLGHIFKDTCNEGYAYQYNIAIMWPKYRYILVALFKSVNLFCEKCLIIRHEISPRISADFDILKKKKKKKSSSWAAM